VTALVVDGGMISMMNGGDGVVDGVQQTTATSNLWSSTTDASRGDGEWWLEATAASVVVGELEKLREKAGQGYESMLQREGRRLGSSRGEGETSPRWNRRRLAAEPASSGERFEQPGGVFSEGKGRGERGECRAL
jgi:hypothetical protein